MGIRSKEELKAARERFANEGVTPDVQELIAKLEQIGNNDPGVVALTSIITAHAAALVEYLGGRVTPPAVSLLASAATAIPWASQTNVKKILHRAHTICQDIRAKTTQSSSTPGN